MVQLTLNLSKNDLARGSRMVFPGTNILGEDSDDGNDADYVKDGA